MFLPNFNLKKFIKYCFIVLCVVLLCNSCNVKAWNNLSSDYTVNYTNTNNDSISTFLIKGDFNTLNNYLIGNNLSSDFNTFYTNVKNYVYTYLGYSSFEAFENDYYYIADAWVIQPTTNPTIALSFYYCIKTSNNVNNFALSMATTVRSSGTPTINSNQTYFTQFGAIYRTSSIYFTKSINNLGSSLTSNNISVNSFYNNVIQCTSSDTSCKVVGYDSTSKTVTLRFSDTDGRFLRYVDSNKPQLDLYFAKVNTMLISDDYVFQKAILGGNTNHTYNLVEPIATDVLDFSSFETPNIYSLGNNSYGINTNAVQNIFFDWSTPSSTTIYCPNDRAFALDTCYLYSYDINDFNVNNVNVSNSAVWLIGGNNSLLFDSSKYYVITFRVYTQYNLDILTTIYHTVNDPTDRPFSIINKYFVDYGLYKDVSLVVQPSVLGSDYLSLIDVVFTSLDNFTNSLNDGYNFGVYRTLKFTEYSSQPTQSDIENEINNNNLSSISNSDLGNYFTNFKINDRGLSHFILLPLSFVSNFKNSTCTPITLPIPHLNNITLPCVSLFMNDNVPTVWNLYKLLINGFIIYRLIVLLFGDLKNLYKPDNDRIEVLDL